MEKAYYPTGILVELLIWLTTNTIAIQLLLTLKEPDNCCDGEEAYYPTGILVELRI